MRILSDRHHSGLAHSLKLLFEDRLEHTLYFPIGMEWAKDKHWLLHKPYDYNLGTAEQYLQIKPEHKLVGDHYESEDTHELYTYKSITLEQFKEMDIDVIIASVPDHWESFTRLRDKYKPNAKVICQMGNHFHEINDMILSGIVKNLMSSTSAFPVSCNAVFYHQEFPLNIFKPSNLPPNKQISSFINSYNQNRGYIDYLSLKAEMPDWEFRSYGGSCDDGAIAGIDNLALQMQRSAWVFHSKHMGDGFGHILYSAMACGRPVITRISDYKGKLGEELMEDEATVLDIDKRSSEDLYLYISTLPPFKYEYMCQQAYNRFCEKVNYNKEAQSIKKFLEDLR